jgi:DNA-directed RNA polymerase specialized sigma subunit
MGSVGEDTTLCIGMSVSADDCKSMKQIFKTKKNMKTEIKFNHNADSLTKALGMSQSPKEIAMAISMAVGKWSQDESDSLNLSILSEYLHNELPYEALLMLATQSVHDKLQESFRESHKLDELMGLLESFEKREQDIQRKTREN